MLYRELCLFLIFLGVYVYDIRIDIGHVKLKSVKYSLNSITDFSAVRVKFLSFMGFTRVFQGFQGVYWPWGKPIDY